VAGLDHDGAPGRDARRRGLALGAAETLGGVVLATLAVGVLDPVAPVVSLGVVYVLPVLLVSVRRGVAAGIVTAILSMLAFNWFHLQPTGTLTLADRQYWTALAVLLLVAAIAAQIAEASRRAADRAEAAGRDARLVAELAVELLRTRVVQALPDVERRLGAQLGVPVHVLLGPGGGSGEAVPLPGPGGPVGRLTFVRPPHPRARAAVEAHIAAPLGALIATGLERERLADAAIDAEAARRSDGLKTTLLRSVGHDLRTPLTQIGASAAALASPSLDDEERRALTAGIVDGSRRLSSMVEKLLDLSRLEAGAAAPRPSLVGLDDVLADALDALPEGAERIVVEVEDPAPDVRADPTQLTRALANLLENALRHGRGPGPEGGQVLVRVARRRGRAVVRIVDRGPGIAVEDRERLFEPFVRGDASPGHGSGLGLAIARGLVEANGGAVRIESYPGQGASFVVELPPAERDAAGDAAPATDGGARPPAAAGGPLPSRRSGER